MYFKNFKSSEIIKSQNKARFLNTAEFLMQAFLRERIATAKETFHWSFFYLHFPHTHFLLDNKTLLDIQHHSWLDVWQVDIILDISKVSFTENNICWTVTMLRELYHFSQSERCSDNCQMSGNFWVYHFTIVKLKV